VQTERFIQVARVFVQEPDARHHLYDIRRKARLRSLIVNPMLTRMLEDGLLEDGWVDQPLNRVHRLAVRFSIVGPIGQRRYYTLTDKGRQQLGALVASHDCA
jgi:PadR family transcriptional regulator, regulatory protein PadR